MKNAALFNKKTIILMAGSLLLSLLALSWLAPRVGLGMVQANGSGHNDSRYYWHEVLDAVDGDTIKARIDGKEESIRVVGIDAPEPHQNECFGSESANKAKEFLSGKWIQIEKDGDSDRDGQGRLLRYIWFDDGTDYGRRLVEEGYAYGVGRASHHKQEQYQGTHDYAKSKLHGLWSTNTCSGKKTKPAQTSARQSSKPAPAPRSGASAPRPSPASGGTVKKSRTGICHAPGTTYYNQTKHFTPYSSLPECLNSGGRMPKR